MAVFPFDKSIMVLRAKVPKCSIVFIHHWLEKDGVAQKMDSLNSFHAGNVHTETHRSTVWKGFLARPSHGGLGVDNTRVVRHLKGTLVENVGDNTRVETYGEEESNQEAIRVLFHSYRHYSCLIEAEDET